MSVKRVVILVIAISPALLTSVTLADDLLYSYEGNVHPLDPSAGWIIANWCEPPCSESLEQGHYVLRWPEAADFVNYDLTIADPSQLPPPTLWVEWHFRSNHPIPTHSYTCDGKFTVRYQGILNTVFLYGDAAVEFSGDTGAFGLELGEFHTYRFESLDGENYTIAVDGMVFIVDWDSNANGYHYLQFGGDGGCTSDQIPDMVNEWDFVRYGTISYGERIVASDPPSGFVDARTHPELDHFTITFDTPNYVYLDEITVETSGGAVPIVTQTRRLDNGAPETVEIVLDRPIPFGETTTFTFNDGAAVNVIEYTYAPADANGNGRVDLFDVGVFQTCFRQSPPTGICRTFDLRPDNTIDLFDLADLTANLAGP